MLTNTYVYIIERNFTGVENSLLEKLQKLKPTYAALGVALAIAILLSILFAAGIMEPLELRTLDHRFDKYSHRLAPGKDIVIVTIDQNSIDYLRNEMQILWKWPRDVYAYTIKYLTRSGASAVLLDFDFSDPDINRAEFDEGQTDSMLSEAINASGTTITSALFDPNPNAGKFARDTTDYKTLADFAVEIKGTETVALANASHVYAPITPIMQFSRFVGASNIYTDMDGVIRKLRLFQSHKGNLYPASALATAMTAHDSSAVEVTGGKLTGLPGGPLDIDEKGQVYLNWYGSGGPEGKVFKYYAIADVFLSEINMNAGQEPLLPPGTFKDKIVLVGSNAAGLYDLKTTPMSGYGAFPGVEIVATAINNLINGTTLRRESGTSAILLIFLASIATALLVNAIKSPQRSVPIAGGLLLACYLYAVAGFYGNVIINMVPVSSAVLLSFVGMTLLNYLTEGREKARVKKAFSQYTSSELMDEILKNPEALTLGGEKRELSILFSDIRGFTSISEKLEPVQLTQMLNNYLTPMTAMVFKHKGVLDKYIGDAVMAIFGAPLPLKDHAGAACRAALDMMDELHALRRRWKEEGMPDFIQNMNIGVGVNSGNVSVGNMGSNLRFDYTVIGDNVNLSSRLESTTKAYGVDIIVSEFTRQMVQDEFIFRELDFIRVIGKNKPVKIYQLLAERKGSAGEKPLIEFAWQFNAALEFYRNRKWDEAIEIFNSLLEHRPQDKASGLYIGRCNAFKADPPPKDWDWVYERRTK